MFTKIFLPLAALLLCTTPDEGQWLPSQIRAMDWDALKKRGMELTKDQFWHPEKGGVLSAAVHINGCTASFVSQRGLVVTNHHCGFGAVAALSSVANNYLENGFTAESAERELPAPGITVFVLKKIEDVTAQVHEAQVQASSDLERWAITQRTLAELEREGEELEPGTTCNVAAYLAGREYHRIYRTRILDVRLAYAPPRAVGEYGGDVDNWEWPRHTGDFTFFRAYVGPDGTPRPHHQENVPFVPEHFLKIARQSIREGDLALIMGYPGNTQRYRTSAGIRFREGYVYPKRDDLLTRVVEVLQAAGTGDPELALTLSSPIKSIANVQKNAKGMVWGLARNAVVARKEREEAQFSTWVAADPERAQRYGTVLADMLALARDEEDAVAKDFFLGFVHGYVGRQVPFYRRFVQACEAAVTSGTVPPPLLRALTAESATANLETIQRPVLGIILAEIRALRGDQVLRGTQALGDPQAPIGQLLDRMLSSPLVTDPQAIEALFASEGLMERLRSSEDPWVRLAMGLAVERRAYFERNQIREGRQLVVGNTWIEAQEKWRGTTFYPDANSTLRVSIAEVMGYVPRDGVVHTPHTTVEGILEKNTGKAPFASPAALLRAAETRAKSRFIDQRLGDIPVCFLTNGDTTGGNSGSPVVNGRGELIGLNFDRVFENVSGDFGWNVERSRNVSVDIRYVLWIVESVQPAPWLLKELGF